MKNFLLKPMLAMCLASSLVSLSSCGGEGGVGSGGTGITAAGLQTGTVSGFGSVIIEGNKYDESGAAISIETEPGNPATTTSNAIKLGMQVRAQFDATEKLTTLVTVPTVVGLVSAVNLNTLIVAGQEIKLLTSAAGASAPTVFEGVSSAAGLAKGDRVEVFGHLDNLNAIIATRIELLDDSRILTKVTGVVGGVVNSPPMQRFSVGTLTISTDSATKKLPLSANSTANPTLIKNGDVITVWSNIDISNSSLIAKVVRVEDGSAISNIPWRAGGPISQLDSTARTLRLGDVIVNFANATFSGGLLADLQNGLLVRVKGNAASTNNRQLNAVEIELIKATDKFKIELAGTISDYSSANSFKVRGTLVNASAANIVFENGTLSNFSDGVLIEMEGQIINGVMSPSRVKFKTVEDSRSRSFVGAITGYNSGTGAFNLLGASARLTNTTVYKTLVGASATVAGIANGANVQVTGVFAQGVFIVEEVRYISSTGSGNNTSPREVRIEGVASMIDLNNRTLSLNGATVSWLAATPIKDLSQLKNGVLVRVEGIGSGPSGLSISASKIEVKQR
jgi:Domain of unknown function (DUF5666)